MIQLPPFDQKEFAWVQIKTQSRGSGSQSSSCHHGDCCSSDREGHSGLCRKMNLLLPKKNQHLQLAMENWSLKNPYRNNRLQKNPSQWPKQRSSHHKIKEMPMEAENAQEVVEEKPPFTVMEKNLTKTILVLFKTPPSQLHSSCPRSSQWLAPAFAFLPT